MSQLKIGVLVDSFRLPVEEGLVKAANLGAQGVQLYATEGRLAPENLTVSLKNDIKQILADHNLVVSAVCADFGGHGFAVEKDNPVRIDRSKRVLDFALEVGANVITTHIGTVPDDESNPRWAVLQKACTQLGQYAEQNGAFFAIETGPEPCVLLKKFLSTLPNRGVRVNFDPANLVMVLGDDIVAGVKLLGDAIVHTHAKDGIRLKHIDREVLYNYFAEGGVEDIRFGDYFIETALGQGSVDFKAWIAALKEIGYEGFLTIEREVGKNPEADIKLAVDFLKTLI